MRIIRILQSVVVVSLLALPVLGQQQKPVSERTEATVRGVRAAEPETPATSSLAAQGNQAAAPRLVKVSGVLTEFVRNSVSSSVEMTFAVYKDEVGGEALWTETQNVEVDKEGRYTVLLGAAQADGVSVELFPAGEPRWLGVEIRGQAPQSRTLLVSVPYALKALDAEKLSGKSLSDFVLSESLSDQVRRVVEGQTIVANQATSTGTAQPGQTKASTTSTAGTTAAGPMFPPASFSGTTSNQIVLVNQNGTGAGLVASSSQNNGVVGQSNSGNGVFGSTSASNAFGVFGFNSNSAGTVGVSQCCNGVYGQTQAVTATTGGFGVLGEAVGSNGAGTGVGGVNDGTSGPANGVYGRSVSPQGTGVLGVNTSSYGGTGVSGFASAVSGFGNGVSGQTASSTQYAAGVVGFATSPTGGVFGVSGTSDSNSGTGVNGYASSTTGPTIGVGGFANSNEGSGVLAYESSPNGQVYGVWGGTSSTSGSGVAGFNFASSGYTSGVYGQSASTSGNGVSGNALATSGFANGVYGQTASIDGAGVSGFAFAPTGYTAGVVGQNNSTSGTGLSGYERATSGITAGITGQVFSPNGIAGLFSNVPGQGLLLQGLSGPNFVQVFSVDALGNLDISGNLTVHGTKSSTAKLQNGRQVVLYAVESPENWFEDFGSAELKGGVAWVPLEAAFSEATNAATVYHVFLTPNGDSNGLYVARKTPAGFEVREHGAGGSNVAFDYRIVVRRRGYEAVRMAEVPERKTEESRRLFNVANTATREIGPVKISPPRQTSRPASQQPIVPQIPKVNVPQLPRLNVPQAPKGSVPQPPQPRGNP